MWMQRVLDFWAAKELYTLIHTHASPTESHGRTTETSPLPRPGHAAERSKGLHTCFVFTPFSRAKALLLLLGGC